MTGVVNLTRLFLNVAGVPQHVRSFRLASLEVEDDPQVKVEPDYASGRVRSYRVEGKQRKATAVLRHPDAADVAWLREHNGVPVWVRSPKGLKFHGVYGPLTTSEVPSPVGKDVSVTFTMTTASEAV